jgi:hypothetical protein
MGSVTSSSARTPLITLSHFSAASALAMPKPMPREPPVTSAILAMKEEAFLPSNF